MASSSALPPAARVVVRQWHMFDAKNQTVGRLAQRVACLLMGKHHPTFNPNADGGDNVTVVNAEQIQFTGRRWDKKVYRYHTGFPGGLKEIPAKQMLEKHPLHILTHAVSGMIPKNKFKHERMARLRVFVGTEHSHDAQFPVDAYSEIEKLKAEASDRISQAVQHPGSLPSFKPEDIGTKHLPSDPIILEAWKKQVAKEEKAQQAWLAGAQPVEQAKDTAGSRRAAMKWAKRNFLPSTQADTKLGYADKTPKKK